MVSITRQRRIADSQYTSRAVLPVAAYPNPTDSGWPAPQVRFRESTRPERRASVTDKNLFDSRLWGISPVWFGIVVMRLCEHHNRVVATIRGRGQRDSALPLTARLNELAGNVARNVERLGNRSPLCHQARQFVRSREIY